MRYLRTFFWRFFWRNGRKKQRIKFYAFKQVPVIGQSLVLAEWLGFLLNPKLIFKTWVNRSFVAVDNKGHYEIWLCYFYSFKPNLVKVLVCLSFTSDDAKAIAILNQIGLEIFLISQIPDFRRVVLHPWEATDFWFALYSRAIQNNGK